MSLVAPIQRRPWIAIAAGVTLLVVLVTTVLLVDLPGKHLLSGPSEPAAPEAALPQAEWSIRAYPAGVTHKVTKAQEKILARRRPEVIALVKRVYDTLFVHPGRLDATLKENFSAAAAIALRRSNAGVSEADPISTTLRTAKIGVEATGGARTAVASVTVRAGRTDVDAQPLRHKATLWMQRGKGGWKVIAFDVQQGPLPADGPQERTKKKGKRK